MDVVTKLEAAMKAITRSDIQSNLLTEEKASRFIREVEESTPVLNAARRLPMSSHTRDIDRIAFTSRVLQGGTENVDVTNESKPTTYLNQLKSEEFVGYVSITDHTLEDNIERENFENTVLELLGGQVGRDLEYVFMAGDTGSPDPLLSQIDGWIKKTGNSVTGGGATPDFTATDVVSMFAAMLDALPKKYLRDRSQWRYYVTWDMDEDYRTYLAENRNTALGDQAMVGANVLAYRGIPIEVVPQLPAGKAMLVLPDNMVYGIYREVRVEPDRIPKARKTDFVVSLRADCHFEDENAVVVADGYTGS